MAGENEAVTAPPPAPDCPFYGRFIARRAVEWPKFGGQSMLLLRGLKDQCAIAFNVAAPCDLALQGKPIHWRDCLVWLRVARELPRTT